MAGGADGLGGGPAGLPPAQAGELPGPGDRGGQPGGQELAARPAAKVPLQGEPEGPFETPPTSTLPPPPISLITTSGVYVRNCLLVASMSVGDPIDIC